jgi:hypothetical protein
MASLEMISLVNVRARKAKAKAGTGEGGGRKVEKRERSQA